MIFGNIINQGAGGAFTFKGSIALASDFPTPEEVQSGWTYKITANVVDNDTTKTNTGQSFKTGDIIAWGGSDWTDITGIEVWIDDGTDVKTINSRDVDLQSKGLKDTFVSTAIKLGDALNTVFSTVNKTIVGAINELKSAINDCLTAVSTDTTLTGNGTVESPLSVVSSSLIETAACDTATATEAKTATLTNFSLTTGIKFRITFENTNTGAEPTLNINSLGAKPIADENGNVASATYPFLVKAGTTVEFTYDGTNFVYINKVVKNYKSTNDWYRIWTNGFIEQGSKFDLAEDHDDYSVSLLLAFVDSYYCLITRGNYVTNTGFATNQGASRVAGNWNTRNTTAFTMATSAVASGYIWEAKGF